MREEGELERGVSMRLFPNLRRTHEYNNLLPFCSKINALLKNFLPSFSFGRKKKYFHGNMPWEHGNI